MDAISMLLGLGPGKVSGALDNTADTVHAMGREGLAGAAGFVNFLTDFYNPATPVPTDFKGYMEPPRQALIDSPLEYEPQTPQGQQNRQAMSEGAGEAISSLLTQAPDSVLAGLQNENAMEGADIAMSVPGAGALKAILLGAPVDLVRRAGKEAAKRTAKEARRKRYDQLPVGEPGATQRRDYVIMSGENPKRPSGVSNERRTTALKERLRREFGEDSVVEVKGKYGGKDENSFMIDNIKPEDYDKVAYIAGMYGQESIFTPRGLLYTDERIGTYQPLKSRTVRDARDYDDNYTSVEVDTLHGDPATRKFALEVDWDAEPQALPTKESVTKGSTTALGEHRSTTEGLRAIDPKYQGTGSAGAEKSRYGEAPARNYHYLPEDTRLPVKPEPTVHGRHAYRTLLNKVYDLDADPAGIKDIALDSGSDLENLVQHMGANGYLTRLMMNDPRANRTGMGVTFSKTPAMPLEDALGVPAAVVKSKIGKPEPDLHHPISDVKLDNRLDQVGIHLEDLGVLQPDQVQPLEALLGKKVVGAMGDRTNSGKLLRGIGDVEFDRPVRTDGGPGFMQNTMFDDAAWAGGGRLFDALHGAVKAAGEDGSEVLLSYLPMGWKGGDFSHMMADTVMERLLKSDLPKGVAKDFDEALRAKRPNWPGLWDDGAREALDSRGALRHDFLAIMNSPRFKQEFPDLATSRLAITDPRFMDVEQLHTGQAMSRLTGGLVDNPSEVHRSYPSQLEGQFFGGLEQPVPWELMFPDYYAKRRAMGGDPSADHRALGMVPPVQEMREDVLQNILRYWQRNPQALHTR